MASCVSFGGQDDYMQNGDQASQLQASRAALRWAGARKAEMEREPKTGQEGTSCGKPARPATAPPWPCFGTTVDWVLTC